MRSRTDLHPYQRRAVDYIVSRPACALWLDLGLGKTISTLTALADLIDGCIVERALVIAPLRVCQTVPFDCQQAANAAPLHAVKYNPIIELVEVLSPNFYICSVKSY